MSEGVPRRDFAIRKETQATKKSRSGQESAREQDVPAAKEIPADVRHTDEQGSGQGKRQRQLAQPGGLIGVKSVAPTGEIPKGEHKKYREQRSHKSTDVHEKYSLYFSRTPPLF